MVDVTTDIVANHDYAYETRPLFRQEEGGKFPIGTLFMFEDEPLEVGRDESGDAPEYVYMRYEVGGPWMAENVGLPVVKCVADDDPVPITQAVAFNQYATGKEIADWWERFHTF